MLLQVNSLGWDPSVLSPCLWRRVCEQQRGAVGADLQSRRVGAKDVVGVGSSLC